MFSIWVFGVLGWRRGSNSTRLSFDSFYNLSPPSGFAFGAVLRATRAPYNFVLAVALPSIELFFLFFSQVQHMQSEKKLSTTCGHGLVSRYTVENMRTHCNCKLKIWSARTKIFMEYWSGPGKKIVVSFCHVVRLYMSFHETEESACRLSPRSVSVS